MDGGQIISVWKVLLSLLWGLEFVVFSHAVGFGAKFFCIAVVIKDVLIEILTYNFLGESKPAHPVAESLRVARRFGCPSFNCLTPLGNIVSGILVYTTCGILRRFKSCTSWGGDLSAVSYISHCASGF